MQVLLGSPPPPPPPNVPTLENTKAIADGRLLTVRERMEQHRNNPACNSCHRVIDPIGLALENFDPTGQYRIKDNGVPVDSSGQLYDGTKLDGPSGLIAALMKRKGAVLTSFTESLMTYAVGRRMEYYDMPAIRAIVRDAAQRDYKMSSFIIGVASSPAFRMSRVPSETNGGGTEIDDAASQFAVRISQNSRQAANSDSEQRIAKADSEAEAAGRRQRNVYRETTSVASRSAQGPGRHSQPAAARRHDSGGDGDVAHRGGQGPCAFCRARNGARHGREHDLRCQGQSLVAGRRGRRTSISRRPASRRSSRSATT